MEQQNHTHKEEYSQNVAADRGGVAVGGNVLGNINVQNMFYEGKPLTEYEQIYRRAIRESTPFKFWTTTSYIHLDVKEKRVHTHQSIDPRIPLIISELTGRMKGKAATVADLLDIQKTQSTIRLALKKHRRTFLLGDPGSGKTTTLKWFARELASDLYDGQIALPLYVDLSLFNSKVDFLTWLRTQLSQWPAGETISSWLDEYLEEGKFVLLLDALNEIAEDDFEYCINDLARFLDRFKPTYCIISCRVFDFRRIYSGTLFLSMIEELTALTNWPQLVIEPLSREQVREYLVSYLGKEDALSMFKNIWPSQQYWWETKFTGTAIRELTTNPFFLSIIVAVYKTRKGLPKNVGKITDEFIEILVAREMGTDWLHTPAGILFRTAIEQLAYNLATNYRYGTSFSEEVALRLIGEDSRAVIDLAVSTNILIYESQGEAIRFSHQIMQEYFASFEYGKRVAKGEIPNLSSAWNEVVILYASYIEDASDFIDNLMKINPHLATLCYGVGGCQISSDTTERLIKAFVKDNVSDRRPRLFLKYFGESAVPTLIDVIRENPGAPDYNIAIDAIAEMGKVTIKPIIALHEYRDTPLHLQLGLTRVLTKIKADDALIEYLPRADAEGRRQSAWALGWIGSKKAKEWLVKLASDSEESVREEAAWGLISAEAGPELHELTSHYDSRVRYVAVSYLGGLVGEASLPTLRWLLINDEDPLVRMAAARSIRKTETKELRVIRVLAKALHDSDRDVRFEVQRTLDWINTPESLRILEESYKKQKPQKELQMDIETIAKTLLEAITPFLLATGTGAAATTGKKIAEDIFEKVKDRFQGNTKLETALDEAVANQGNPESMSRLKDTLEEEMQNDESLPQDILELLKDTGHVTQNQVVNSSHTNIVSSGGAIVKADRGGIAVGGNVSGGISINQPRDKKQSE